MFYLLERVDPATGNRGSAAVDYEDDYAMVVRASDPGAARRTAANSYKARPWKTRREMQVWLDPKLATCRPLNDAKTARVILIANSGA